MRRGCPALHEHHDDGLQATGREPCPLVVSPFRLSFPILNEVRQLLGRQAEDRGEACSVAVVVLSLFDEAKLVWNPSAASEGA